ncbi:MAG: RNA polymerase sigma factor [Pseudomonadota bacterium]
MTDRDMMRSDVDLIGEIAAGDQSALRALYERHRGPLLAFLKSKCGDAELAADAAQDAMIEVWTSASKFSGKSSPKTWMFAIARNKLVDRLRKDARLTVVEEPPEVVDDAPDPTVVIARAQDATRVRACLANLSESHRSVIELAFFHELKYEEIAEVEGAPLGTIKTRIYHAKKLLMRCLGER